MRITGMDHIVLRSPDIERSIAFYHGVLGLEPVRLDEWRAGKAPFPSVRVTAGTIIDLLPSDGAAPADGQALDHFCLVVDGDLYEAECAVQAAGDVIGAKGNRFGARGRAESFYFVGP
ncbi:MAG: VOC family virulence protein [SAR202 cluster bacterium]|nr:VOC family virulence protein [SAR202 cluster bacterium]